MGSPLQEPSLEWSGVSALPVLPVSRECRASLAPLRPLDLGHSGAHKEEEAANKGHEGHNHRGAEEDANGQGGSD